MRKETCAEYAASISTNTTFVVLNTVLYALVHFVYGFDCVWQGEDGLRSQREEEKILTHKP